MKKVTNLKINKNYLSKISKVLLSFGLLTSLTACQNKSNKENNQSNINQSNEVISETGVGVTENNSDMNDNQTNNDVTENNQQENVNDETEVVNYYQNLQSEFSNINDFSGEDIKNWAFDKLNSTINFITNKEPIGNIYFKDLTQSAKGVVIGTFTYMDEKLIALCPDYKEKASAIFNKTKDEFLLYKETVKNEIISQIGQDKYDQIKNDTNQKIESIKQFAKDTYEKIKEKILK